MVTRINKLREGVLIGFRLNIRQYEEIQIQITVAIEPIIRVNNPIAGYSAASVIKNPRSDSVPKSKGTAQQTKRIKSKLESFRTTTMI
jgi:hypothetical protein